MRTEQIYYVLETVKTGSFTQAAQNLYLKPPGLRAGITTLEEELGYKIFDRHTNGVTLTAQGKKILPKLYEIIQIYECLKISLPDIADTIVDFRISLTPNQYDELLISKSTEFLHRINPLLRVKFLNSLDPIEQIKMLLNHQVDIAQFTIFPDHLKNEPYLFSQLNRSWKMEAVGHENIVPVVASNHPLAQTNEVYKLEDLQPYTIILNSLGNKALSNILQNQNTSVKFDVVYLSSSRKEFSDYLSYNAIYFCPSSLLTLDTYAKLVPLQLKEKIIFENCLAYRINDDNPFLSIYADFLRNMVGTTQTVR
ncbi:MAG: LysR family transcriptional regulator [Peptococcaceae bacterium]|nr:LysR family transcriptional regulator [Peptococcaceae bacterium]